MRPSQYTQTAYIIPPRRAHQPVASSIVYPLPLLSTVSHLNRTPFATTHNRCPADQTPTLTCETRCWFAHHPSLQRPRPNTTNHSTSSLWPHHRTASQASLPLTPLPLLQSRRMHPCLATMLLSHKSPRFSQVESKMPLPT